MQFVWRFLIKNIHNFSSINTKWSNVWSLVSQINNSSDFHYTFNPFDNQRQLIKCTTTLIRCRYKSIYDYKMHVRSPQISHIEWREWRRKKQNNAMYRILYGMKTDAKCACTIIILLLCVVSSFLHIYVVYWWKDPLG